MLVEGVRGHGRIDPAPLHLDVWLVADIAVWKASPIVALIQTIRTVNDPRYSPPTWQAHRSTSASIFVSKAGGQMSPKSAAPRP